MEKIKLGIISDTHGNLQAIDKMAQIILESDYVFHLGDHFDDMKNYAHVLDDKLYRVCGNCDWGTEKDIIVKHKNTAVILLANRNFLHIKKHRLKEKYSLKAML